MCVKFLNILNTRSSIYMNMEELKDKYYVFIRSSFQQRRKNELFEYIYQRYGKRISLYISNLIPVHDENFNDLFQDIMIKIYKNLHTFNPAHSFKAWIYQIVRNHCIDFLKSKNEKNVCFSDIPMNQLGGEQKLEKNYINKVLIERIEDYLRKLDPVEREIAFLRFYENISFKNISKVTDLNVNTARSKIHMIKKDLKEKLRGII